MMYNFNEGTAPWVLFERVLDRPEIITEATRFLVNDYYTCVFFSHKNEVYKWFYTQLNLPATPFITLPEGEEIRCLNHYQMSLLITRIERGNIKDHYMFIMRIRESL